MSYILDALRKSEQQRQATQPDTVTERILVNQQQTNQKSTKWLIILAISNIAAVILMAWFYFQKSGKEIQLGNKTSAHSAQQAIPIKAEQSILTDKPVASENNPHTDQALAVSEEQKQTTPSIAQMLEQQKEETVKTAEINRSIQQATAKKPIIVKKEIKPTKIIEQKPEPETSAIVNNMLSNVSPGTSIPDVKELTAETRSILPKLNINVFSYAEKPSDRFVIIDMVKYKTGQLIKDNVRLKEIRPDSSVLQDQYGTCTCERPLGISGQFNSIHTLKGTSGSTGSPFMPLRVRT